MSADTLNDILKRINSLTVDEQRNLAANLVEHIKAAQLDASARRRWRDIRGLARPSLLGEDAQAWVSRTRRESDEKRER